MSGEKGRFSCYIDLSKSEKTAQAYYFLKSLGNLRQDIIIDMVLRTLGDDIFLDFEHMSRAEAMAVYNENVYAKKDPVSSPAVRQTQRPAQETRSEPSPEICSVGNASFAVNDGQSGQTVQTKNDGQNRKEAETGFQIQQASGRTTTEIEEEKPFSLDEGNAVKEKPVGLKQIQAARRTQTAPPSLQEASGNDTGPAPAQNDPDDLDSIPDDDASFVASMISDSFQDS